MSWMGLIQSGGFPEWPNSEALAVRLLRLESLKHSRTYPTPDDFASARITFDDDGRARVSLALYLSNGREAALGSRGLEIKFYPDAVFAALPVTSPLAAVSEVPAVPSRKISLDDVQRYATKIIEQAIADGRRINEEQFIEAVTTEFPGEHLVRPTLRDIRKRLVPPAWMRRGRPKGSKTRH